MMIHHDHHWWLFHIACNRPKHLRGMWGPYSGATAIQPTEIWCHLLIMECDCGWKPSGEGLRVLKIFEIETNLVFENWQEGCHADNSSGGVSLCQSVALDVEDFGNGALETECEVVKTVGGNSQNRKLETNNWFTYRRRFGWPPWIQKQYTQKRLHSHPTSTKSFILGIRPVELFYPSVQSSPFSETQVQVPTSQTYQIDPPWPRAGCQFLCSLWTLLPFDLVVNKLCELENYQADHARRPWGHFGQVPDCPDIPSHGPGGDSPLHNVQFVLYDSPLYQKTEIPKPLSHTKQLFSGPIPIFL